MGLHGLPVDKRVEYKMMIYTYKALLGWHQGIFAESNVLMVPPGKPGKYGSRSFVRASANLWDSLRGE